METILTAVLVAGFYASVAAKLLSLCLILYTVEAAPEFLGRAEPVKSEG